MVEEIKITSLAGRGSVTMKTRDYKGYWLGMVDWGQASGQHQTYSFPTQVGEEIASTSIGSRTLSIPGWVVDVGNGTLQERCDFLNAFISPVEDYTLEYNGKKINFRPDSSIIYGKEKRSNNKKMRQFLIQATCPYPLFSDVENTNAPFDSANKQFRFPTEWGQSSPLIFSSFEKSYSVYVENTGAFQTGMSISIDFSGEVESPRIKNLTAGNFIGVVRTFQKNEHLYFSTVPGKKNITMQTASGEVVNLMKNRDYKMSWIQLLTGVNVLALDCDDLNQRANMTASISYTPLYLEVE